MITRNYLIRIIQWILNEKTDNNSYKKDELIHHFEFAVSLQSKTLNVNNIECKKTELEEDIAVDLRP